MLPPGLSMLWEAVEPRQALAERFGLADPESAAAWAGRLLAEHWGVTLTDCSRLVISARNALLWGTGDAGPLVVKWSTAPSQFARLTAAAGLLRRLADRGVPVAAPLPARDGRLRLETGDPPYRSSVVVLPELAGAWLDVADERAVRDAGACLARLHAALRSESGEPWRGPSDVDDLPARLAGWLTSHDHGRVPAASARLARLAAELPPLRSSAQLVHNDFRAANVLTEGSRVVGLLDFDDVLWEHPVADLAKASVYLSTLFRDWGPTSAAVREVFVDGYADVRPLDEAERRWLAALVLWFGLTAVPAGPDPTGWGRALVTTAG